MLLLKILLFLIIVLRIINHTTSLTKFDVFQIKKLAFVLLTLLTIITMTVVQMIASSFLSFEDKTEGLMVARIAIRCLDHSCLDERYRSATHRCWSSPRSKANSSAFAGRSSRVSRVARRSIARLVRLIRRVVIYQHTSAGRISLHGAGSDTRSRIPS